MARRKTHEEYVEQVKQVAPHIRVNELYNGNRNPISHYCEKHNVYWDISPFNFLQHPTGCKECQKELWNIFCNSRRKTNEQFIEDVKALGMGITPLDEYVGEDVKINFKCIKNHIFLSKPHDILQGYGCPYCAGQKILRGYNDLWTLRPDIAQMLSNHEDGYNLSIGSNKRVDWTCPDCGGHKLDSPKQVIHQGLSCNKCSDGISYPNKFIISLLSQLQVLDLESEWSPNWLYKMRYDAHFYYHNKEYVVEMDGGIGHGNHKYKSSETDVDGLNKDRKKDVLASEKGIIIIRIDCAYTDMKTRFQYVVNSIYNSELAAVF